MTNNNFSNQGMQASDWASVSIGAVGSFFGDLLDKYNPGNIGKYSNYGLTLGLGAVDVTAELRQGDAKGALAQGFGVGGALVGGTVGTTVGVWAGGLMGGVLAPVTGGFSVPVGAFFGGVIGGTFVGSQAEWAVEGWVEKHLKPDEQPWTAGGHWLDLDFDLSDQYTKPGGPDFGGHIHSGYTGPGTGYDTPSEKISPVDRPALPATPLDVQTTAPTSGPLQPSMVEPYILDPTTIPLPNPPVQPYILDPIRPVVIDPAAPLVAQFTPSPSSTPVDLRPNVVVSTPRPTQTPGSVHVGSGTGGGGGGGGVGGSGGSIGEDRNDRGSNGYGAGNYEGMSNSGSKGSGSLGSSSARGGGASSGEYSRTPSEGPTPNSRPDRSFPGKDKDDRDVGRATGSRPERSFPGKEKDDRGVGRVSSETYSASGSGRGSAATGAGSSTRTRADFRQPPTRGGGWVPVIMDLTGNGLDITTLGSSSKFIETNSDGYEYRTAWAGDGNGVLVIDLGGDGKITDEKEFAFAQWDPSASGDLAALKSVFDTNGNGKLDAGDARWAEFKVMVGDQLVSLASLGIASIDLTPTGTGRVFSDGSAITGTTTFTRTDGTTGAVGDAVLAGDATGYIVKRSSVTNADGSTTTDISGFTKAGAVAFRELVTVGADKSNTTTRYDDDGNGTFDRSQTSILTIAPDGTRTRVVSDFRADGSLSGRTTTITASDKRTVTTLSDGDGDGITDERQVFVANADGSTSTTVEQLSASGAVLKRVVITASSDGLTKVTNTDSTGSGAFDLVRTEATVIGADGSRTKTITLAGADGTVMSRSVEAISANGRAQSINLDHIGNGRSDERRSVTTELTVDGAVTTTVHVRNEDGSLRTKTITTNSASGLSKIVSADLTGDDVIDRVSSNVTSVAADGMWTETLEERSANGSLLSRRVSTKSANRANTSISDDKDGDGLADETAVINVAADGSVTTTITTLAPNGSIVTRTSNAVSADGLTQTTLSDLDGDGAYDVTVVDSIVSNAGGSRTQTVAKTSTSGASLGRIVKTVSADSLTIVMQTDIDGDGMFDISTTDSTQLHADGSRARRVEERSANGSLLGASEIVESADRKTITMTEDAETGGGLQKRTTTVVATDGSKTETIAVAASDGTTVARETTRTSANGLTRTVETDADGNGTADRTITDTTVINGNGSRARTVSERALEGALLNRTTVSTSGNGLVIEAETDRNGDGIVDERVTDVTAINPDGSTTRTVSSTENTVRTTTSANGLGKTVSADLNADGVVDRVTSDTTVLAADGSRARTIRTTAQSGRLMSQLVEQRSADGVNGTVTTDGNGDGAIDQFVTTVRDAAGIVVETTTALSTDGAMLSKSVKTTSANQLTRSTQFDRHGRGVFDEIVTERTQWNADGTSSYSVERRSENNMLIERSVETTSADGLTVTGTLDINGDGQADRSVVSRKVLNADGSQLISVETRSGAGGLLSRDTTSINASRSYAFFQKDTDGDGQANFWETKTIAADGGVTTDRRDYANNGQLLSRTFTYADGNGFYRKAYEDLNGDLSTDFTTETHKVLHNNGGNTVTTTKASANDTRLSRHMVTTSGDGFSITEEVDLNGDGVIDQSVTTATLFGNNGAKAVTKSTRAGTSLIGRSTVTTSATRLSITTTTDLDGEGDVDDTTIQWKALNVDGSTYMAIEKRAGNGTLVARTETNTSADGKLISQSVDHDGNGVGDRWIEDKINDNGDQVHSVTEQGASGAALSASVTIDSANRLMTTKTIDLNGDGTADLHRRVETTIAADGSIIVMDGEFAGNWTLRSGTRTTTSASGLTKQIVYADSNYATLRAYAETTTINQDGSTSNDRLFFNGDWSRESYAGTWTSADKRTTTLTRDVDGDLVADQFVLTQIYNDGTNHQVFSDYGADGQTVVRQTVVDTSGNGLSQSTTYDFDGNGTIDAQVTKNTAFAADGTRTATTDYSSRENGALVLKGREVASTSGNGLIENVQWDDTGAGSLNRRQSKATVLDADGSRTTTDQQFANGQSIRTVTTVVSANGLVTSRQLDFDGDGSVDQRQTDTKVLNTDGTVTRTVASTGLNAAVLSTMTTTTSADGKTVTTQNVSGIEGVAARTTVSVSRERADGGSVKVDSTRNAANQLVERITTTVSDDKRLVQIDRDTNGDGQLDQSEQVVTTVEGRRISTLTSFAGGALASRMTTTEAADGLLLVSEVDRNGDGTGDTRKVQQNVFFADGSRETVVTDTDLRSGRLRSKTTKITSADGKTYTETSDVDGDGVLDQTVRETILASGTRQTSVTNTVGAQKQDQKANSETYWNDKVPAASQTTTSADGLVKTTSLDVDGDGRFEVSMDSRTRIDGSVVTTVVETNADGSVKSRGLYEVSHDGIVNVFRRDGNNDGSFEFVETTTRLSSGGAERTTVTRDNAGAIVKNGRTSVDSFGNIVHSRTTDGGGRTLDEQVRAANGTSTRTTYVAASGAPRVIETLDAFNVVRSVTHLDPANAETWARIEQTFDEAGVKTFEKQFLDDGTTADLYYRASDGLIYESRTFAGNGVLTSISLYDAQGRRTGTVLHDPLNKETWTRVEQTYDTAGVKTLEKQFLDDNTRAELQYRATDGVIYESQTFASNGALTSRTVYDAQGRKTSTVLHDPLNLETWVRVEQTFDVAGVKTLEKQFMDDGTGTEFSYRSPDGVVQETRNYAANGSLLSTSYYDAAGKQTSAILYDPSNQNTWSRVEQTFDAAGVKTVEKQFGDNGTRTDFYYRSPGGQLYEAQNFSSAGGLTSRVEYDALTNQAWLRREHLVDAQGRTTQSSTINDDGTSRVDHFDAANTQGWSNSSSYYNAAGQLYFVDQRNDNGTRSTINYDVNNSQGWARYEQLRDVADRVLTQTNFNDNGTRSTYSYDPTNAQPWSLHQQNYNAAGQLSSIDQTNDDGSHNTVHYDVDNNQGWARYEQYIDGNGRLLSQVNFNDDGSRHAYSFDPANTQTWAKITQVYNAAGALEWQTNEFDGGLTETTRFNVYNNQPWVRLIETRNAGGALMSEGAFQGDNSRFVKHWDASNNQDWSYIEQRVNGANAVEWQMNRWDDGSTETTTYNVQNSQPWARFVQARNASGALTSETAFFGDTSRHAKFWDPSNGQSWAYLEQYINAAGQVTAQFQKRDDGSVEELRFNGQATARQLATFDANYYLAMNPDIANGWHAPAIEHYSQFGWKEGRRPNAWFDGNYYLQQNADIKNAGLNPFEHWRANGYAEGRPPHAGYQRFDGRAQSDLAALNEPLFADLQLSRIREMRRYAADQLSWWLPYDKDRGRLEVGIQNTLYQVTNGSDRTVLSMYPQYVANRFGLMNRPVVLDLDGDNHIDLRIFSPAEFEAGNGPRFDWDGDGVSDGTGWIGPNDGWLAIDLASDGSAAADGFIDQAKELAFTMWKTYDELAEEQTELSDLEALRLVFDTNGNNQLDAGDARWSEFRIWRDANQNGATDAGELRTLAEADVSLIELVPSTAGARQFADGSAITGTSSYLKGDGTRALVGDVKVLSRPSRFETAVA